MWHSSFFMPLSDDLEKPTSVQIRLLNCAFVIYFKHREFTRPIILGHAEFGGPSPPLVSHLFVQQSRGLSLH